MKHSLFPIAALAAAATCLSGAAVAATAAAWPPQWEQAATQHALQPEMLYAAAVVNAGIETNGRLTVWPWTVRIDGKPRRFSTAGAAAAGAKWAAEKGRDVAIGLFALRLPNNRVSRAVFVEDAQIRLGAARIAECLGGVEGEAKRARKLGRCLAPTHDVRAAEQLGRRIKRIAQQLAQGARPGSVGRLCGVPMDGERGRVARLIVDHALRAGIDPAFALAIARSESAFRQKARSHAGAIGVMQLMPATARRFGVDPYDLEQNISGGTRYLAWLAEEFDDVPALVAAGYNAGEGAVRKYNNRIPPYRETVAYVPRVLQAREDYSCSSI